MDRLILKVTFKNLLKQKSKKWDHEPSGYWQKNT